MELDSIFAQRLKETRQKENMTQKDLAEKIGITPATISAYENLDNNKRKSPTFEIAVEIANVLDVSLDWLGGRSTENKVGKDNTETTSFTSLPQLLKEIIAITGLRRSYFELEDKESPDGEPSTVVNISLSDEKIVDFMISWEKIHNLFKDGSITEEMRDEWISGALNKYSEYNIDSNGRICKFNDA
jgi:transcriptional regulator with XRE-family HTH domain